MRKTHNYKPQHKKWASEYERICYTINGGVYRIRNKQTGRCYFGTSQNLRDRFTKHLDRLKAGAHHNHQLQDDYDECGKNVFVYELLVGTSDKDYAGALESIFIQEACNDNRNPYNRYKLQKKDDDDEVIMNCYEITQSNINKKQ
jgi:group I intron endonuclease